MANDCWNKVVITGSLDTLKKIKTRFESSENGVFNINNYHTLFDTDVSDMDEEDFGSKRFIPSVEIYNNQLIISGDSAWSPVIGLFERICSDYQVEATLDYEEMGCDFAGRIVWDTKGVELENQEWTYWERLCMKDPDNFWEEMQYRYEIYEDYDELLEDFHMNKWKDQTILDTERLKTEFEEYLENN